MKNTQILCIRKGESPELIAEHMLKLTRGRFRLKRVGESDKLKIMKHCGVTPSELTHGDVKTAIVLDLYETPLLSQRAEKAVRQGSRSKTTKVSQLPQNRAISPQPTPERFFNRREQLQGAKISEKSEVLTTAKTKMFLNLDKMQYQKKLIRLNSKALGNNELLPERTILRSPRDKTLSTKVQRVLRNCEMQEKVDRYNKFDTIKFQTSRNIATDGKKRAFSPLSTQNLFLDCSFMKPKIKNRQAHANLSSLINDQDLENFRNKVMNMLI